MPWWRAYSAFKAPSASSSFTGTCWWASGTPGASGPSCSGDWTGAPCSPPKPAPWTSSTRNTSARSRPGEVVVISRRGYARLFPFPEGPPRPLHLRVRLLRAARLGPLRQGRVFPVRQAMGRILAKEQPVGADAVVPVPDSGLAAAMGYSEESGIPLVWGLIRNHYVGRTFIAPRQSVRDISVAAQAQRRARPPAGQAGGPGGRLPGAGHHLPQNRPPRPGGRGRGGAPAPLQPAHREPLRLRHRHARALGTPGGQHGSGGDHAPSWGRTPWAT